MKTSRFISMRFSHTSGFTLIEILVVVAIIGLLMGIAMDYLSSAKQKGGGAGTKQNLNSMRTELTLWQTVNNGINFPCNIAESNSGNVKKLWDQAKNRTGGKWGYSIHGCASNSDTSNLGKGYIFMAKVETGKYWCIDSSNAGKIVSYTDLPAGFNGGGVYSAGDTTSYLCP